MLHENILLVRDEGPTGSIFNKLELRFERADVSIAEIIAERVRQEVGLYNQKAADYRHVLVRPKDEELELNKTKHVKRLVNAERQVKIALDAFEKSGFLMLVDDLQVESLEQRIVIKPDTVVSFVKLTQLVGG